MKKSPVSTKMMYKTKQEYVYQLLRDAIMTCELEPNQKLVISNLAEQFEVSTIPVREALQQLHSEGLVNNNAHTGPVVSPITKSDVVETFTIKEGLEGVATRVASEKMTANNFAECKKQLAQMDEVLKTQNYEEWGALNAQFHGKIVKISAMPVLEEMYTKVLDKWERIRRYFFSEVLLKRHNESQKDHYDIVQAIEENDPKEAERLTKLHNQHALRDYMRYLEGDSQLSQGEQR